MQKNASCCWVGPKLKTKQVNSELFNFNSLQTNVPVVVTSQRRRGWESWDLSFTPLHAQPFDCYFWRVWSFIIILRNFKAPDVLDSRTACMAGRAELDRGRRLRAKCKSLSKTTWNHQERQQNNSVENVFQRFVLSLVSFIRRKHDFRRRISTFVWRILFKEPRIWTANFNLRTRVFEVHDRSSRTSWHAQWPSCCKNTSGWPPWYQERLVLKFYINSGQGGTWTRGFRITSPAL